MYVCTVCMYVDLKLKRTYAPIQLYNFEFQTSYTFSAFQLSVNVLMKHFLSFHPGTKTNNVTFPTLKNAKRTEDYLGKALYDRLRNIASIASQN